MKKGIVYAVGVGPGDPELMTLKAVRLIKENNTAAFVGDDPKNSAAYKIAVKSVPELEDKNLIGIDMPMTKDVSVLNAAHEKGAALIEKYLDRGENVVYLTLGDPTVYCSFEYLKRILESDGYITESVNGVASFCAAAAKLGIPLVSGDECMTVLSGTQSEDRLSDNDSDSLVIMKSGKKMSEIRQAAVCGYRDFYAAENVGLEDERVYDINDEIPEKMSYFSIAIVKKKTAKS